MGGQRAEEPVHRLLEAPGAQMRRWDDRRNHEHEAGKGQRGVGGPPRRVGQDAGLSGHASDAGRSEDDGLTRQGRPEAGEDVTREIRLGQRLARLRLYDYVNETSYRAVINLGTNVVERTREIGVMKAIGGSSRQIAGLVVGELQRQPLVRLVVRVAARLARVVLQLERRVRPLGADLVPLRDLAEENVGEDRTRELDLRAHALDVVDGHDGAERHRDVEQLARRPGLTTCAVLCGCRDPTSPRRMPTVRTLRRGPVS